MHTQPSRLADWLPVIHRAFAEPSELRLTVEQASARWALDITRLQAILDTFVNLGYLSRSSQGVYARRADSPAE